MWTANCVENHYFHFHSTQKKVAAAVASLSHAVEHEKWISPLLILGNASFTWEPKNTISFLNPKFILSVSFSLWWSDFPRFNFLSNDCFDWLSKKGSNVCCVQRPQLIKTTHTIYWICLHCLFSEKGENSFRSTNTNLKCTLQAWTLWLKIWPKKAQPDKLYFLLFFLSVEYFDEKRNKAFNTARDLTMNWFLACFQQKDSLHHPHHEPFLFFPVSCATHFSVGEGKALIWYDVLVMRGS